MNIGVLLSSTNITRFYSELLKSLEQRQGIDLFFLIESPIQEKKKKDTNDYRLFASYLKVEKKIFGVSDYPLDYVKMDSDNDRNIHIETKKNGLYTILANKQELDKVKRLNIDLFIRVGWGIIGGAILDLSRFGIWSLHHGDNDFYRGKPSLFWEFYEGQTTVGCILQKLNKTLDGGEVIDKITLGVNRFSITRTYYNLYYKSLEMILLNLDYLIANQELPKNNFSEGLFYSNHLYKVPNIRQQLVLISKLVFRNFQRKVFNRSQAVWMLSFAKAEHRFLLYKYKPILNRKGFFTADPFVIARGDKHYVFYEEAHIRSGKGHIGFMNLENLSERGVALQEDFHLSFPFLFNDHGRLYMIPETRGVNEIRLYECTEFPHEWKLSKVLMKDVSAVDTVLHKVDGLYFLFTSISRNEKLNNADNLYVFWSNSLVDEFQPVGKGVFLKDVRGGRNAGSIFRYKRDWYRVAQNGSGGYGAGLNLYKITELSKENYKEVLQQSVSPNFNFKVNGLHSFNFNEKYAVIDVLQ